ncbi:MAG: hypothetical protein ACRYHA_07525 [Janthinobacterium lividum]
MIIAVEVDAHHLAKGMLETLRFAEEGFVTRPADDPPNAWFEPVIKRAPTLDRLLFDEAGTYGASKVTLGNVVLVNVDGSLDALVTDYAFDGRRYRVRMGNPGQLYRDWQTVMAGTLSDVIVNNTSLELVIQDRLADLAKWQRPSYAGNNVLPDGVEGTKDDLKGQTKPRVYGRVWNVAPVFVNTAKLVYQVSDTQCVIDAAYDRGIGLSRGPDYRDIPDLLAVPPGPGQYRCFLGHLRLGSMPVGEVTCDAISPQTRPADLLMAVACDAGLVVADIDQVDVDQLNALAAPGVGVWADADVTTQTLMDALAGAIGAWYGFDRLGRLRMGRIDAPVGPPRAAWGRDAILAVNVRSAGIPAWKVNVRFAQNGTVQNDVGGAVPAARVAWLAQPSRIATAENAARKIPWPHASEITFDTPLIDEEAAMREAVRRLDLYGVRRSTFDVDIPLSELGAVDLGDVVQIVTPRFGLERRLLRVIGINAGYDRGMAALVLWG